MKKALRTRILAGAAATALLCGTAVAASTVTTKMIEASYKNIRLVVDGVEVTPKDANGNVVEPFVSEGTTYLPVRAIGEALGKEVTWDGNTSTVYVGSVPGQSSNWMKKLPPYQVNSYSKVYDGSNPREYFSVGGVNISEGVYLESGAYSPSYALWNTNLKYKTMTFTIGQIDNKNPIDMVLDIYLDGEPYTSYTIKWDNPPKTITVPLNWASNVKLQATTLDMAASNYYGIYNISFS